MYENLARDNNGRLKGDETLVVQFFLEPVEKTLPNGETIWEDVPFIKISVPGDNSVQVYRRAQTRDKHRFVREWAAFEAGESNSVAGYPIREAGFLKQGEIRTLLSINVFTVEQLADLRDDVAMRYSMMATKQKAKVFLESKKETDLVSKVQAQMAEKDNEMAAMKAQLEEMRKFMQAQAAAQQSQTEEPAKRGRPANKAE